MKKLTLLMCCFAAIKVYAQKLPEIQSVGLYAPANVRIDGKYMEWNDSYAAENKRTSLFYSVANDDKNLYLIVKSTSAAAANKILLGGITFTINTDGKRKEKDGASITYPIIVRTNRSGGGRNGQGGGFQNRGQLSQQQRDSASLAMRKGSLASAKEIKVVGIKAIPDSLISIYNEYGIKSVVSFDQQNALVYELAIPLNLLELSLDSPKEFAYQIKLNGMSTMAFNGGGFGENAGNRNREVVVSGFGGGRSQGYGFASGAPDLMSATDFWGKYSLVKK